MTLRQLHAINDRHVQALECEEWLYGVIASTVANFSQAYLKRPLAPNDFGLGPKLKSTALDSSLSDADQTERLREVFSCMAGKKFS